MQAPKVEGYQTSHKGHAIEVRLNAEDPFRNFAPSAGTLGLVQWPQGKQCCHPLSLQAPKCIEKHLI